MDSQINTPELMRPEKTNSFLDMANLGKNQWWRYLLSLVIIFVGWQIIGGIPYGFYFLAGGTNQLVQYLVLSFSFVCFISITILVTRWIHNRPILSLFTANNKLNWKLILVSGSIWSGISLVITLIDHLIHPGVYQLNFNPGLWLPFAAFAIVLTPIQTTSEEVFFRGFLLQAFGLFTKNKWILILLSGILFAIPHFLNPEMQSGFWILAVFYFGFGVLLAYLTIQTNSLELALGIHAANNLFTVLIANYKNSAVESPSIFLATTLDPMFNLISFVIGAVIYWFILKWIKVI